MPNPWDEYSSDGSDSVETNPWDDYAEPQAQAQPEAQQPETSMLDTAAELAAPFGVGSNALLKIAGDIYGLTTGDMDNFASQQGQRGIDYWNQRKSKSLLDLEENRSQRIDAADGEIEKAGVAMWDTITSPSLMTSFMFEQAPMLVVTGGAGVAAGGLAKAAGAAAGTAAKVATAGAVGAGAVMQGSDAGTEAYSQLTKIDPAIWAENDKYKAAIAGGASPDQAIKDISLDLSQDAAISSAIVSGALNMIPGARILEKKLAGLKSGAGSRLGAAAKGFVGESIQEAGEEAFGQSIANITAGGIDVGTDLSAGVGEAAGMGALAGVFGGGAGALTTPQATKSTISDITKAETVEDALSAAMNMMEDTTIESAIEQAQPIPAQAFEQEPLIDVPSVEQPAAFAEIMGGPEMEPGIDVTAEQARLMPQPSPVEQEPSLEQLQEAIPAPAAEVAPAQPPIEQEPIAEAERLPVDQPPIEQEPAAETGLLPTFRPEEAVTVPGEFEAQLEQEPGIDVPVIDQPSALADIKDAGPAPWEDFAPTAEQQPDKAPARRAEDRTGISPQDESSMEIRREVDEFAEENPDASPTVLKNFAKRMEKRASAKTHPLSGFFDRSEHRPAIQRAIDTVKASPEQEAVYVETDLANLGGLNKAMKSNEAADVVFKEITDLVNAKLQKDFPNSEVVPFHHGGDEFSFIVTGATDAQVSASMESAKADVRQHLIDRGDGLEAIPNPKHASLPENERVPGVGIYVGTTPIMAGSDVAATIIQAGEKVELNKKAVLTKGKTDEQREQIEAQARIDEGKREVAAGIQPTPEPAAAEIPAVRAEPEAKGPIKDSDEIEDLTGKPGTEIEALDDEQIKSRVDELGDIASKRYEEAYPSDVATPPELLPVDELSMLTDEERTEMADLKQKLPSFGQEQLDAKDRIAKRIEARKEKVKKLKPLSEIKISQDFETDEGDKVRTVRSADVVVNEIDTRIDGIKKLINCLGK